MNTNKVIDEGSELERRAKDLIKAAADYWEQYAKDVGGHFVLFTRGEYKASIMAAAHRDCAGEPALFHPFTAPEES